MADRVDSMSDAELRTKLAEHGFPVMPITASTKKLLVKKLKHVLDNKSEARNGSASAETRRSLARYSSGEDSDLDADSGRQRRGRRATTGGAMPPPPAARTRRATPKKDSPAKKVEEERGSESEDESRNPVKTHEEVETVTTRRITRMYKPNDEYETGSDSDVDVDKGTSPYRSDSRSSDYISSTLPASELPRVSPPKPSYLSPRPTIASGYTSPLSGSESLNSIRSRLGLSSSFADRPSLGARPLSGYTSTFKSSVGSDEVESPYLSNFGKRLSTLASEPLRSLPLERDDGGSIPATYVRKQYAPPAPRVHSDYRTTDKKFLRSNFVSLALLAIVTLFFFFLFSIYLLRKNDMATIIDDKNGVIPTCQLNIPGNRPGINCVPKEQVSYAKNLLQRLRPELSARAAAFKCGEPDASPFLTEREILELPSTLHTDREQHRTDLYNLQVLLVNNPQWGISVVEMKGIYSRGSEHTQLKNMNDVALYRAKGNVALMITDPSTPLSCLLAKTFYSAGSTILLLVAMAAGGYGAHRAWKMYAAYRKRRSDEVYSMVEQIIDMISQECEESGEPYMSVTHVRDMIIPPHDRDRVASVWDAAIAFIKKNESRVRMEVQCVDGEDCQVWRWVSPRGGSPRGSGAAWQGQAFETQEGSVNNLSVSPTPCLKIRHMFDKNESNPQLRIIIQDAILEKVGDQCKILHIDLDRASCCVYVKCASPMDAGVVYKSLHGWWYEGKLITVKYLRLERYMIRFPNSPSVGPYLKPSRMRLSTWND